MANCGTTLEDITLMLDVKVADFLQKSRVDELEHKRDKYYKMFIALD